MSQSIIYDNLPAADRLMARPAQARGARRTFLLWGSKSKAAPFPATWFHPSRTSSRLAVVVSRVSERGTGVGKLRELLARHLRCRSLLKPGTDRRYVGDFVSPGWSGRFAGVPVGSFRFSWVSTE